jgi:negative regulator of replication initiation
MSLNTRAYDKVYAKVKAIENEIKSDQYNIDNKMVTRFIPMELHLSVLEYKKRQKKIYEYILNLINEKRDN